MPPTAFEHGAYEKGGGRRWPKAVRFVSITYVKAGWLHKEKGIWSLTDDGANALATYPDPEDFQRAAMKLYRKFKTTEGAAAEPGAELSEDVPDDVATGASVLEEAVGRPGHRSGPTC